MSRRNAFMLAALSAALLAGCGGGDQADETTVVVLTDRPAVALALADAMPDHDVQVQETPAAAAAAAVAAWANRGARMVVAHYTPGTIQSACQEAKRLHIGCVVTDPIDLDSSRASAITYSGETYCDLDWLDSAEAQGKFLAQCMTGQRGVL